MLRGKLRRIGAMGLAATMLLSGCGASKGGSSQKKTDESGMREIHYAAGGDRGL